MSSPQSSPGPSPSPSAGSATPRKTGRPDELGPIKLGFMQYFLVTYKNLVDSGAPKKDMSLFLTAVARAYADFFGLLDFKAEPATNPGRTPSLDVTLEDLHRGVGTQAEVEEVNKFTRDIRKKILNWFQNHKKRREEQSAATDLQICLDYFKKIFSTPPTARSVRDVYTTTRWQQGLGEEVAAEIAANPTVARLTTQNLTISKSWARETEEYKEEMDAKTKALNDREMESYKLRAFKISSTSAEYAQSWDDAESFLFPALECMSVHMGVAFSFFFFGPDPHQAGRVVMRSLHSDVDRGQAGIPWSQLPSFQAVRASGEEFARRYWGGSHVAERAVSAGPSSNLSAVHSPPPPSTTPDEAIDPFFMNIDPVIRANAGAGTPNIPEQPPSSTPPHLSAGSSPPATPQDHDGFDEVEALIPPQMDHSRDHIMVGRRLGPRFEKLLRALLGFEEAAGHLTTKYHQNSARPVEIAYWHKTHRPKQGPKLLPKFGERLMAWWTAIQPPKRVYEDGTLLQLPECEWAEYDVFRCGQYGITLVVLAIAWYGNAINVTTLDSSSDDYKLWCGLVVDATWVLEQMTPEAPLLSMAIEGSEDEDEEQPAQKRTKRASKPASKAASTKPASKRKRSA